MGKIFNRFFNVIIGVGFIPIIFVVIVLFYYQSVNKKKLIENHQRLCDSFAISSYQTINNFAKRLDYLYYLKSVYTNDEHFLKKISEKYDEVIFAALLDKNGKEIKRYSPFGFGRFVSRVDISKEEYFSKIKNSKEGVIGEFKILKDPVATIVYPLNEKFIYIVVNFKDFFSYLYQTKIGLTGFFFFIGESNVILSDGKINIPYNELSKITDKLYGSVDIFIDDAKYISVFRKISDVDLYVIFAQKKKEFFRDINLIFYLILFLIFLILTISYYIAFTTTKNLALPISSLINASRDVGSGNFNNPVKVTSDFEELNELIKTFNLMLEKLNEYSSIQVDKLQDEKEKLDAITQNLRDVVVLFDMDGNIVYKNKHTDVVFGQDLSKLKKLIVANEREIDKIINIEDRFFEIYIDKIKLKRQNPLNLVVLRDVTLEINIYKVKEEVFRSIAHDLRNPILNMQGYIKLLSYSADEKTKEYLNGLENESNIIFRMIENILDMARIENKKLEINPQLICLNKFLKEISKRFEIRAKVKKIDFSVIMPDNDVYYKIDEELFQRAVDNILTNAFKYTDEGGKINIELKDLDRIYIIISDNGKGIEKSKLIDIFNKFSHASKDGFGLGLSIAKTIIDMHGGRIEIDSTLRVGTTVSIILDKK